MSGFSVFMTAFILKLAAMLTMAVDHVGLKLMNDTSIYRFFGRTAFVLYAFLAAESVIQTVKKGRALRYITRLLILAVLSEIPYDLCISGVLFNPEKNNVIITILFGCIICLTAEYTVFRPYSEKKDRLSLIFGILTSCAVAAALCVLAKQIHTSYHYVGILLILAFYLYLRFLAGRPAFVRFPVVFAIITLYVLNYTVFNYLSRDDAMRYIKFAFMKRTWIQLGSYLALPFILFYNRKQGPNSKVFSWFYRLFYPVHMLIIYFITRLS